MKGKRIRTLLQHNISLIAYHLPLDAHPVIGNNAVLADELGLTITGALYPHEKHPVGNFATCPPTTSADFAKKIEQVLGRMPLHISDDPNRTLTKIALCTGGAQDMITQAYAMGCQAFISGKRPSVPRIWHENWAWITLGRVITQPSGAVSRRWASIWWTCLGLMWFLWILIILFEWIFANDVFKKMPHLQRHITD